MSGIARTYIANPILPQVRLFVLLTFSQRRPVPGIFFDTQYIFVLFLCALAKACTEKTLLCRKNAQAVEVYSYFDADHHLDQALRNSGFADKSGDDLVRFLEHGSEVEVESFLYSQKLALQSAFESILGRGGEKGSFAKWVGEGPSGEGQNWLDSGTFRNMYAQHHTRNDSLSGDQRMGMEMAMDMMSGGSGELGSGGTRPGGAPAGFYVQLKWMDGWVQKEQNRHIADRRAGMNVPVLDTIGGILDPIIGMGYYQQMARIDYGTKGGLVAEASLANFAGNFFKAAGGVAVGIGVGIMSTGVGVGLGAAIASLGAGVVVLGNSMHANMMTGEKGVRLTDRAAADSVIQIGLAAAGGYFAAGGSSAVASEAVKGAAADVTVSNIAQAMSSQWAAAGAQEMATGATLGNLGFSALGTIAGAGMKYNAKGQSQGFDFSGKAADAAAANWALGSVLGFAAGGLLGNEASNATKYLGNKVASDLAAYGTQQIYGAEFSSYSQLGMTGDWGGAVGLMMAWGQDANKTNQQRRAAETMQGAAVVQARREQEQYEAPTMTREQAVHRIIAAYEAATGERLFEGDRQALLSTLSDTGLSNFSAEQADMFLYQTMGVNPVDVDPAAFAARYAAHAAAGQQYDANVRADQALQLQNRRAEAVGYALMKGGDPAHELVQKGLLDPVKDREIIQNLKQLVYGGNNATDAERLAIATAYFKNPGASIHSLEGYLTVGRSGEELASGGYVRGIEDAGMLDPTWYVAGGPIGRAATKMVSAWASKLATPFKAAAQWVDDAFRGTRAQAVVMREPTEGIVRGLEMGASIRGSGASQSIQRSERILNQALNPKVRFDTLPSDSQLIRLAQISAKYQREFNIIRDTASKDTRARLFAGGDDWIMAPKPNSNVDLVAHIHPKGNILPSWEDFKYFKDLTKTGSPTQSLAIVTPTEVKRWTLQEMKDLVRQGLIQRPR